MRILLIDTATERSVLALLEEEQVVDKIYLPQGLHSSRYLLPHLEEMLQRLGMKPKQLEAIAVGIGPGSYTGIRVGVSVAQSFSYALALPLIPFPSLCGFVPEEEGPFLSVLDARIGGMYFLRGEKQSGGVEWYGESELLAQSRWEEEVRPCSVLVSPNVGSLQKRMTMAGECKWEERSPDLPVLANEVVRRYRKKQYSSDASCKILYLRDSITH